MKLQSKKILSFVVAFSLVLGLLLAPITNTALAAGDTVTITILGTSDIHGALNSWSYESSEDYGSIGLERIHSLVKQVRSENPNTLLIDNGDTIQGSILTDDLYNTDLEKPNPMMDVMNAIGYDSMTLGNHEFNFGLDLIDKIVQEANFPILSANIYKKADGENYVKPYVIKEVAGIKVGIIGLTVPSIPMWDGPRVTDLEFKHMAEEAKKYVEIVKQEGADIVIASAHAGLDSRHEEDGADSARKITEYAPDLTALLVGHDHSTVNETINGVLVGAPAASSGQSNEVVRFDITLEKDEDSWSVVDKKASILQIQDYEPSEDIITVTEKYHNATLDFLKDTIGTATDDFHPASEVPGIPEAQIRDTAVIDIINEVQLKYADADVAAAALFKNNSNLPKGDISYANIFDIYKYANKLVGVEVTGKELKNYMEWSAAYYNTYKPGDVTISFNPDIRSYNYDMFAGVDYKIDISKPAGQRIVDLTFKDEPIKDDQVLKLAINDYRYSGLINMGILSNEPYFNSDPISLRSYIKTFIQEKGSVSPEVDNNWEITGADMNNPLRDKVIQMVKDGAIEIPTSADGRTPNVKSLNLYELVSEGKLSNELLKENNIPISITILHTNDMHARVKEGDYDGMGFAKVSTKIKDIKAKNPNTLVLDAGDVLHGQTIATISKGESIIRLMNAIGYDALTPGNHDFNYGQDRLIELSDVADFPIVSSNVVKNDGTTLLKPYVIKEISGVKIGIFGLSTPDTTYMTHPKNVEGLKFEDPIESAKKMVTELKDKADIIVALTHIGLDESSSFTTKKIAEQVEGINLIVDGHSHTTLEEGLRVGDTLIVQAGDYNKNLGTVNLAFADGEITSMTASLFAKEEAAELAEDPEILELVKVIEEENEQITSVEIGETKTELVGEREKVRAGETNLGNLITEAMLDVTGADIALTNGGGIRASINAGKITKGDVITVLPFGNYVVMKEVKGEDIFKAIEHGISSYPELSGSFPHVAGITFKFDPNKEAGNRLIEVKVKGNPIVLDKAYKLATNDFLAAGGDNYLMLADDKLLGEYPALDEVVIEYIQKYGLENIKVDNRVQVEATAPAVEVPEQVEQPKQVEQPQQVEQPKQTELPKQPSAANDTYTVTAGDVLWKIAEKFGLAWESLAEFNNLQNPHLIFPGQKILIPVQ